MVDRTILAAMEQLRSFDFASFEHDVLVGVAYLCRDILSQTTTPIIAGLAATQTATPSLTVNIAAGSIYSLAPADLTATGAIPQDLTGIVQQGLNVGQQVTVTAPSAGQSQWWLIQCQFSQTDVVRANDPNGGVVPFFNVADPTIPIPTSINTERQGLLVISTLSGAAATTGSQVPPQPSTNWTPMYLISVVGGQTAITTAQILRAGPSVGPNVPSNYPQAPFLAGFLAGHHSGAPGQAPKINLATEVSGVLPYPNMSPVRQLLGSALTLFVNGTTGSDSLSGLSPATPFRTIQAAVNAVYRNYDFNGNGCTISVANGTYAVSPGVNGWAVFCVGLPLGLGGNLNIIGNTGSPGSVALTVANGNGILASSGARLLVSGITLTASGTVTNFFSAAGYGLMADAGGVLNFQNVVIGSCGTCQLRCQVGGLLTSNLQPFTLTGTTPAAYQGDSGGLCWLVGATITVTGLTTTTFAVAVNCNILTVVSATFVGAATGARYGITTNGVINTGGGGPNFLPGNSAGSASAGGQYL